MNLITNQRAAGNLEYLYLECMVIINSSHTLLKRRIFELRVAKKMLTVNNMLSYQCLWRKTAHHTSLLPVKRSTDARKRCISPKYTAIVAKNIGFSWRNNLELFCQASFNRASFPNSTGNSGSAKWTEYKAH